MSAYVLGLLLRNPIPGADPAHKIILAVLEENLARKHQPSLEELGVVAQVTRATLYRKISDLKSAGLLERRDLNPGKRTKAFEWIVHEDVLKALNGDFGEGAKERAEAKVKAGFEHVSNCDTSQDASHDATQAETSQAEKPEADQGLSQSENPPLKNPPLRLDQRKDLLSLAQRLCEVGAPALVPLGDPARGGRLRTELHHLKNYLDAGYDPVLDLEAVVTRFAQERDPESINVWTFYAKPLARHYRDRTTPIEAGTGEVRGTRRAQRQRIDVDAVFATAEAAVEERRARRRGQAG